MIHILVVDDDKNLNQTVCTYLNDCGFEAKGVLSANEAYDEMYNNLYELIISDIMMPEIDGFEFAETVRQVNEICSLGRERQKNFLAHASRMIRENFVRNFGLEQLNYMTEREKNFSQRFAPYVHEGNVIPLSNEFERAYSDISRNGNAKIIFTDLCIKVMQNIRPN